MNHERPTQATVGPLKYKIKWEDDYWAARTGLAGQHEPKPQVIHLHGTLAEDYLACLFVHEVIHAIVATTEPLGVEYVCDLCGEMLTHFWQDNPVAFAWYCEAVGLGKMELWEEEPCQ